MDFQEEYLFWKLANYFISDQEYRIVQLSSDQSELWLEKMESKEAKLIRLLRYNLDWSNWMQKDIEHTAANGEQIRKQLGKGDMQVLNIYVSAHPPVDDYEFRIEAPYETPGKGKTKVKTIILDRSYFNEGLIQLGEIFQETVSLQLPANCTENEVDKVKHKALSTAANKSKKEKSLFSYGRPFFTYVFIVIQVAVFLFLEWKGGSTNTETLIKYGAKFNPLILEGEWWRFFTPIVLHIGMLHLLMNTLALFYLGPAVERIYGNARFLIIYIMAGFIGSLASFLFSPSLSAGASGAIFGCFGALLYFGLIYPKLFFRTMGFNIFIVLGINLAFGFTVSGIDNAGHIGGLIGGFLATGIVHFPKKKKFVLQVLFLIASVLVIYGSLQYGFNEPQKLMDEQSALVMAQEYIKTEEYDKAYTLLSDFVQDDHKSPELYFLLSYAEIKKGKMDKAKEHLHYVINQKSDFHEAYFNLALLYLDEKNIKKAKDYAQKAADLNPEQDEYQNLLNQIADWESSGGDR